MVRISVERISNPISCLYFKKAWNKRSGFSFSATVIALYPLLKKYAAAWSQFPECGRVTTTPRPASNGPVSASPLTNSTVFMIRSLDQSGKRKVSHQYLI